MANRFRYRHGQTQLVKLPVDSSTVIEIGDMVFLDTDDVKPASSFTWTTDLATTQGNFAAKFIGIACESSASGDTDKISVDISPVSVYEMDAASDTYIPGAPLGPDKDTGNALLDQTLEDAVAAASIARVYKAVDTAGTKVEVTFASAYNVAANNVNGVVG